MKPVAGIFCYVIYIQIIYVWSQYAGYHSWTPSRGSRDDLFCPDHCLHKPTEGGAIECCACHSKTCWDLDPQHCNVTIASLCIEYMGVSGSSIVMAKWNITEPTYYELEHSRGRMSSMPSNLCDYSNLITLVASYNRIVLIGNISCLQSLNTLDLSYNRITILPNTTFSALHGLRHLYLSNNQIETLDANALRLGTGTIFLVNISSNPVYEIDYTNIIIPGEYCVMNFSETNTLEIKNDNNFKVNTSSDSKYGPGFLDFSSSTLGNIINFTDIGVPFKDLLRYFDFSFTIKDSHVSCDCALVPLLQNIVFQQVRMWVDVIDNFTCRSPPHMLGFTINQIVDLNALECDIEENCPRRCLCTDKQNTDIVFVDCSNANLTEMPDVMPVGSWDNRKLVIDFSGNNITSFENKEYLDRIVYCNFSGNAVNHIAEGAFNTLKDDVTIDLSGMQTESIPLYIQKKSPYQMKLGSHPIQCNCTNRWVGEWLRSYNASGVLYCKIYGIVMDAKDFNMGNHECDDEDDTQFILLYFVVAITCLFSLIIVISLTICLYRYELLIIVRRLTRKCRWCSQMHNRVFISFDGSFDKRELGMSMEKWVLTKVIHRLSQYNIDCFTPSLDIMPGENRNDAISDEIQKCRTYIILLTTSYLKSYLTVEEFRLIWQHYRNDGRKNIILINYDYTSTADLKNREMKALLRVGGALDFTETSDKMLARIEKRIKLLTGVKKIEAWK